MIKIVFSIIQLILIISPLYAIDLGLGVKGGLSIHNLRFKFGLDDDPYTYNFDYRIGPTIALFGELKNCRFISQQISIGYFQAGGTDKCPEIDESGAEIGIGNFILKLDYLFIAYQGKLHYMIKNFVPYILFGVQYEYLINLEESYTTYQNKEIISESLEYSESNKNNISPLIGFGVGYKIKKVELQFEFFPLFHLFPFFEHEITDDNGGAKHTTKGFVINTGIKYDL